jgi:hypothetical protein
MEVILVVLLTNLKLFNRRRLYTIVKIAPVNSKTTLNRGKVNLTPANKINSFEKYPEVNGSATKAMIGTTTPTLFPQEFL